jgi:hypothetical protein
MPEAVPQVLRMILEPRGIMAWMRFISGMVRLRLAKKSLRKFSQRSFNSRGWLSTAARAWRVRSSGVGPMPPEMMRVSHWGAAFLMARSMATWSSPTVVWARTEMPMAASCWESHAEFVSIVWPRTSSSPMEMMMAVIG